MEKSNKEVGLKEELGVGGESRRNLIVYDCPVPLYFRFIDYVKKHSGGRGWVAVEMLLDYAQISKRVDLLEERLTTLEKEKKDGKV